LQYPLKFTQIGIFLFEKMPSGNSTYSGSTFLRGQRRSTNKTQLSLAKFDEQKFYPLGVIGLGWTEPRKKEEVFLN
jgi:hypothetical protein